MRYNTILWYPHWCILHIWITYTHIIPVICHEKSVRGVCCYVMLHNPFALYYTYTKLVARKKASPNSARDLRSSYCHQSQFVLLLYKSLSSKMSTTAPQTHSTTATTTNSEQTPRNLPPALHLDVLDDSNVDSRTRHQKRRYGNSNT